MCRNIEIRSNTFCSIVTSTPSSETKSTVNWWNKQPATSPNRPSPVKGTVFNLLFLWFYYNSVDVCRAWRLLSIVAAYFACSDTLLPYLMEHLTSAANDRRRACHGTAAVCLTNLRKTQRCGGRKNVPSVEEVTAVSAGKWLTLYI